MSNPKGRPVTTTREHRAEVKRRGKRAFAWRSKRAYFEAVLIANGLWKPGKVERA